MAGLLEILRCLEMTMSQRPKRRLGADNQKHCAASSRPVVAGLYDNIHAVDQFEAVDRFALNHRLERRDLAEISLDVSQLRPRLGAVGANQHDESRSPGRTLPIDLKVAATYAAIAEATESFPERRPATTTSSFTRLAGGSRSVTDLKNSRSDDSLMGIAKAPRRMVRQLAHDDPENIGPNSRGSSIAETISGTWWRPWCRRDSWRLLIVGQVVNLAVVRIDGGPRQVLLERLGGADVGGRQSEIQDRPPAAPSILTTSVPVVFQSPASHRDRVSSAIAVISAARLVATI